VKFSIRSHIVKFVFNPNAFMRELKQYDPNWTIAISSPLMCSALQFVSAVIVFYKLRPFLSGLFVGSAEHKSMSIVLAVTAFNAAASYVILCGMSIVAMICIEIIFKDGANNKRLAEAVAICFLSQVP
jgi:hypothetical protein